MFPNIIEITSKNETGEGKEIVALQPAIESG